MPTTHTRFYRDKQNGKVAGVAAGVADYTGIDPLIVRIGMLVLILATGWALFAYIAVAFMAPCKPAEFYKQGREEKKFWQGVRASPTRSSREVQSRYRAIDRRLADLETLYTSRNRDLAREIDDLR